MNQLLKGKTALVTGAAKGIGKTVAVELARQGANVTFTYLSSVEKGQALESELAAFGIKAKGYRSDASDFKASEELVNSIVAEFGSVDIIVNNAGITKDGLLMRMSESDWDTVLNTNLRGAFLFTKALTRTFLKQRSGRIINVASVIGLIGNAGQCNYAASKAGLIGFTKSVAKELASRGITANVLAPGFIETRMTAAVPLATREVARRLCNLSQGGQPQDIAEAITFLASPGASGRRHARIHA